MRAYVGRMESTKKCPWCAEEILAEAKKCKHCGEFLPDEKPTEHAAPVTAAPTVYRCPDCAKIETSLANLDLHRASHQASGSQSSATQPVWRFGGVVWRCISHDTIGCLACTNRLSPPRKPGKKGEVYPGGTIVGGKQKQYSGRMGQREKLSQVGDQSQGVLACPKCGSTQFTAKRSNKGKVIGITTLGVGGLIAPKSQVKCVACGTMFKRG